MGGGKFLDRLKKDNYEVMGLSFRARAAGDPTKLIEYVRPGLDKRMEVPSDARVVIILGPSEPIPKETLDALDRYLQRNGKLIVMLDVVVPDPRSETLAKTGLEDFLRKYNVEVTNKFILGCPNEGARGFEDLNTMIVPTIVSGKNDSGLARQFRANPIWMVMPRVIQPLKPGGQYKVEPLLEAVSTNRVMTLEEDSIKVLRGGLDGLLAYATRMYNALFTLRVPVDEQLKAAEKVRLKERPAPVAVTVSEGDEKPRIVVFGDADWASNLYLLPVLEQETGLNANLNFNLQASSVDWLSERPGIGIRPKETGRFEFPPNFESGRMIVLPGWLMGITILALGIGIWVVRRR
jgi:hypothetical protein